MMETVPVEVVFAPEAPDMYLPGAQTWVEVTEVTRGLCGKGRPGHFRGVTTVVAKLFNIVKPHLAFFGEKDFQQLRAIQRMVADLNFDVEIVPMPIVRERRPPRDVVAQRVSDAGAALRCARAEWRDRGGAQEFRVRGQPEELVQTGDEEFSDRPGIAIEYVEVVDAETL